ncbi:MAG TPA: hypothetical protein VM736_01605 [Gemmatimonadales bacterium]|nr:hypothetical protein [Gemmatimonadales bacterium]
MPPLGRALAGVVWLASVAGRAALPQEPAAPGRPAARPVPEPILVELRLGNIAVRTVPALLVRSEVLVPLSQFLELAEIPYRVRPEGRVEATVEPGDRELVIDAHQDTMRYGAVRVPLEPDYRVFKEGELYVGAERLGDLLGAPFAVDFSELSVTMADPGALPVARRLQRDAARAALLAPREAVRPDLVLAPERRPWGGLVFDYSVFAPSGAPLAGSGYTGTLGADAFGGSLELGASSVGRAADGVVSVAASWTGVWRDDPWLKQLRLGDGVATGPAPRSLRGVSVGNSPFVRPSVVGLERYAGQLEPGGGWSVDAYQAGQLVGYVTADAAGRFNLALPVRYGENPVDFVAYGPHGVIREFSQTFGVISELLPARRFEYGAALGSCRQPACTSTANLDLHYGVTDRWTVRGGVDQFWRDTLPDLTHPYASIAGSPVNAWGVTLDGVAAAFAHGSLRYEPSIDRRLSADYTRYATGTRAPLLTPLGARSRLFVLGFWRPSRRAGFFFFDGLLDRETTDLGSMTSVRLENSVEGQAVRALPYVRLERDAFAGTLPSTRSFVGTTAFLLPRPALGPVLGPVWLRGGAELELGGPTRLSAYSLLAARPLGAGLRLEAGVSWLRGGGGATLSLTLTSYLSALRSYTTVSAPAGGPVTGTQYVQGSVLWDGATGRLATAPGPSLERSGVSGRVFLDQNGDGVQEPGEPGLAGVRVRVGTSTAVSDAHGEFRVWDVVPFEPVTIQVDSTSLPSPLLVPAFASALLEPGPNEFRALNVPVVQAGVIEGRVVRARGGEEEGVAGVALRLVERRRGFEQHFTTFSDGAFYVMGVKPGDYELRVEPRVLAALRASATPLALHVDPGPAGAALSGLVVRLTPAP